MSHGSYPPQFSMNSVSNVVGNLNDLAGSSNSSSRSLMPNRDGDAQAALSGAARFGGSVPVVITGTQNPDEPDFPGLREAMIGSAIWQIAQQASGDDIAERIKELALELHRRGAQKILDASRPANQTTKKPTKKRK